MRFPLRFGLAVSDFARTTRRALFVALAAGIVFPGSGFAAELMGFYKLDGDATESSGFDFAPDAIEMGAGAVNYVAGLDGQAASFDGSGANWIQAPINGSGDVNPTFSRGAWVKANDPNVWGIFLSNDNGGWDRVTQQRNGFWSLADADGIESPHLSSTDWTFIAHTFDGVTQRLYVDDLPVFERNDAVGPAFPHNDIGRNANGAAPFNGLIDNVFFFNDTLTPAEITTIRTQGAAGILAVAEPPPPPPPPTPIELLALYRFDGNADDSSPAGNNATVIGNVTFVAGLDGQAASFPNVAPGNFVEAPFNISQNVNAEVTIGAWVKSNNPGDPGQHAVFSNDDGNWDRIVLAQAGTWIVSNGGGHDTGVAVTDEWTFVAVSYDGDEITYYIDDFTLTIPDNSADGRAELDFGQNGNDNLPWDGLIDNAFVFQGALSADDIAIIRANGAAGVLQVGNPIPEPSTLTLAGLAVLAGLGFGRNRRRRSA